jgi:hypothetical protein
LAKIFNPELDPSSITLAEHDYVIKFMCYVENFEVSIESKNGGKTKI